MGDMLFGEDHPNRLSFDEFHRISMIGMGPPCNEDEKPLWYWNMFANMEGRVTREAFHMGTKIEMPDASEEEMNQWFDMFCQNEGGCDWAEFNEMLSYNPEEGHGDGDGHWHGEGEAEMMDDGSMMDANGDWMDDGGFMDANGEWIAEP